MHTSLKDWERGDCNRLPSSVDSIVNSVISDSKAADVVAQDDTKSDKSDVSKAIPSYSVAENSFGEWNEADVFKVEETVNSAEVTAKLEMINYYNS